MWRKGAGAYPGAPPGFRGPAPPSAEGRLNGGGVPVWKPCLSND